MLLVNKYLILSNFSHRSRLGGQETCTQRKSLLRENLQENLQYFLHVPIEEILKRATFG